MDMVGMGEVDFDLVVVVSPNEVEAVYKKEEDLLKRLLLEKFGFDADAEGV